MTSLQVLTGLLEAEHATVWAYGLLGARLSGAALDQARAAHDAHRRTRDALVPLLRARGAALPAPAPAYDVRTADRAAALALAIRLEDDLTARWHDLVAASAEPGLRRLAVTGLQDCAVRAARWRLLAQVRPVTQPFPGRP
jgi:hypothetical protein